MAAITERYAGMPYVVMLVGFVFCTGDATLWPGTALVCAGLIAAVMDERR